MRDAEYEEQKARWMALSRKWLSGLGLDLWEINYHWFAEPLDARHPSERDGSPTSICETKEGRPAHVFVQWPYMAADFEIDLRVIARLNDRELGRLFLHEMAHVLLGQLEAHRTNRAAYRIAEEHTATMLARIFEGLNQSVGEDTYPDVPPVEQHDYDASGPSSLSRNGTTEAACATQTA